MAETMGPDEVRQMMEMGTMLDSHVLNANPKERLSEEERLERVCARRREADLERRARIFDAKRRTLGLDKEALDAQVVETQQRRQKEHEDQARAENQVLKTDKKLKLGELQKQRARREMDRECKEFSLQNLSYESRLEFDLNDPNSKRNGMPARVGDDDPRCGPASGQQFNGEDLMKPERERQQRLQQINIIEQQKFEKAMMAKQHEDDDKKFAQYVAEVSAMREDIDKTEVSMRRDLQQAQRDDNMEKAKCNLEMREANRESAAHENAAEIAFHSDDTFLNETGNQQLSNGRVRRDAYKGSTREERVQASEQQQVQREAINATKDIEKQLDTKWIKEADNQRRKILAVDREKQRQRQTMVSQVAEENRILAEEQKNKKKYLDGLYVNEFKPEFFAQFGTSSR